MNYPFHKFQYTGLIGWLDAIFALFFLWQTYRGILAHDPFLGAIPFLIAIGFAFCASIAFSSAGYIQRLPWLTPMALIAGFLNISFGIFAAFGSDNSRWFYLFLLMGIGNFASILPKRESHSSRP